MCHSMWIYFNRSRRTFHRSRMNSQAQAAINKARSGDVIAIFDVKSSIQGVSGISVKDASAVSVEIQ